MFTQDYILLTQEGHLTMSSFLGGLNSIRNANIDENHRGLFYSGLFELATGFERLMKIVLILDYKLNNNLISPTNEQLKKFSHNIDALYSRCADLPAQYSINIELKPNEMQRKIISTISNFAKSSRYYNLDVLTNINKDENPISQWLDVIDDHIWSLRSDVRTRLQDSAMSEIHRSGLSDKWHQNIDGEWITMVDYCYLMKATDKANPYVIWSMLEILHPFYSLLKYQCMELQKLYTISGKEGGIPHMYEFFPFFLTPKSVVLRKKQWAWGK
ncbi:hypothetical protein [Vibrio metschnikovii]|uniref:hypothetical protein n=1 Tax=Vibrio metschnikovii TaxID=28172 RepID=UPI001C2F7C28|nr:hypothetical protein [Vibrio metschnikovii]